MHNRTACNDARTFITTNLTHPRIPPCKVYCLSTASTFRLVHSEFRQYFHTFSPWISDPRHIGSTIHLWTAFVISLKTYLTAALCRLHRAYNRKAVADFLLFGVSGWTLRGVTPSFHPSKYQFSKVSDLKVLRPCV